jgi:hypothetical protein
MTISETMFSRARRTRRSSATAPRPAGWALCAGLAAFAGCAPGAPARPAATARPAASLAIAAPADGSRRPASAGGEAVDFDLALGGAGPEASAARPEDVATPEGIVQALYATTWGPPGQPRQWARLRTLIMPGARFVQAKVLRESGANQARVVDLEGFIAWSESFMLKEGFFERETHHQVRPFGRIAHVFSAYETRWGRPDAPVVARGVNSFNLIHDGRRWWIASVAWDTERPGNPMPATTP